MPLTNTQYDQIMRGYQDRQLKRQQLIDTRRDEIAAKIPKITELDAQIASLSVRRARQLLDGDASALTDLHDQIQTLSARKQECLQNAGYPADYFQQSSAEYTDNNFHPPTLPEHLHFVH